MNVTVNVGNCDFKFYSHYVYQDETNLRMLTNLLRTQDELKTNGFLLSVSINLNVVMIDILKFCNHFRKVSSWLTPGIR